MKINEKEKKYIALKKELEALYKASKPYQVYTRKEVSTRVEIIDEIEKIKGKNIANKLRESRLPRDIYVGFVPTYANLTKSSRVVNDLASDKLFPPLKKIGFPQGVFVGHETIQCKVKLIDETYEKSKLFSIPKRGLLMSDCDKKISVEDVTRQRKKRKDTVYSNAIFINKMYLYATPKNKELEVYRKTMKIYILEESFLYENSKIFILNFLSEFVNKQFDERAKKSEEGYRYRIDII